MRTLSEEEKKEVSARIFSHLKTCRECQQKWESMGMCFGLELNADTWSNFCRHQEECNTCKTLFNEIVSHALREITVDDLEKFIEKQKCWEWGSVEYGKRQVYAAAQNVPLEVCLDSCPYFKGIAGGGLNIFDQPGACCFCRSEAKEYNMEGDANCITYIFSR